MRKFDTFCVLDNHSCNNDSFDFLVAFKKKDELINALNPFLELNNFINQSSDWLFGYLTYDLKNNIETLYSNNIDNQLFPKIHFFHPQIIIKIIKKCVIFLYDSNHTSHQIDQLFEEICQVEINKNCIDSIQIRSRVSKETYINNIIDIQKHLQAGDIYEMNYCQEFYSENVQLDPFRLFSNFNNMA